jgi:prepilin-type N-terminal cleavage/methylation domain-containing protein
MSKLKNNSGMTLIEMLCVLLILVILIMGMGSTMDAGTRIYQEAIFESDSATLAGILNTSMGDILRYSRDVKINEGTVGNPENGFVTSDGTYLLPDQVGFVFSNWEYGILDAYFYTPTAADGTSKGVLQMLNLRNANVVELVNTGAYPDLVISNLVVTYVEEGAAIRGGYFEIEYDIFSEKHADFKRHVDTVVRLMND